MGSEKVLENLSWRFCPESPGKVLDFWSVRVGILALNANDSQCKHKYAPAEVEFDWPGMVVLCVC